MAIFSVFSIVNLYHIVASASFTMASFFMTFFVFTLTMLTLYFTINLLVDVDWQIPVTLLSAEWFSDIF
ncbi:MAG: hypothetical protein ABII02_00645 [Candidatus Magasanikbacteria bacterium]